MAVLVVLATLPILAAVAAVSLVQDQRGVRGRYLTGIPVSLGVGILHSLILFGFHPDREQELPQVSVLVQFRLIFMVVAAEIPVQMALHLFGVAAVAVAATQQVVVPRHLVARVALAPILAMARQAHNPEAAGAVLILALHPARVALAKSSSPYSRHKELT
jgi:hypothetical protein